MREGWGGVGQQTGQPRVDELGAKAELGEHEEHQHCRRDQRRLRVAAVVGRATREIGETVPQPRAVRGEEGDARC